MPVYQARSANACLRDDGRAEVRFRQRDNSSVSVTMPEAALHVLAQQIAEMMIPSSPASGRRPREDDRA